jgi:hypothetical protein
LAETQKKRYDCVILFLEVFMRILLSLIGLLFASNANAGSFGLYGAGGIHEGKAYYYRDVGTVQGIDSQYRPHAGSGFEMMLGDKDNRLIGQVRLAWNHDWALNDPTYTVDKNDDGENYTYSHPDYASEDDRDDGVISVGLQWGIWGEPTALQIIGVTAFSSGFWTVDSLEYFMPEAGLGATYTINDQYQFHSTVSLAPRYRKGLLWGTNAVAGVRYLFD